MSKYKTKIAVELNNILGAYPDLLFLKDTPYVAPRVIVVLQDKRNP